MMALPIRANQRKMNNPAPAVTERGAVTECGGRGGHARTTGLGIRVLAETPLAVNAGGMSDA